MAQWPLPSRTTSTRGSCGAFAEWKANPDFLGKNHALALQRLETFSDFFPLAQFLLSEQPDYDVETLTGKLSPDQPAKLLKIAEWELEKASPWTAIPSLIFQKIAETEEMKLKQLMPLFFVAMSGTPFPSLLTALTLLGPDLPGCDYAGH